MLLVADDVWTSGQLAPFVTAGQAGRLLVTTRRPAVLAGAGARSIGVDAVPREVARRILARGLPQIAGWIERDLLELAGGWPLLLSLINARLAEELGRGAGIDAAARDAADRLRRDGQLAREETDALPLIRTALSGAEWKAVERRIAQTPAPSTGAEFFALMLDGTPPDRVAAMLAGLPRRCDSSTARPGNARCGKVQVEAAAPVTHYRPIDRP